MPKIKHHIHCSPSFWFQNPELKVAFWSFCFLLQPAFSFAQTKQQDSAALILTSFFLKYSPKRDTVQQGGESYYNYIFIKDFQEILRARVAFKNGRYIKIDSIEVSQKLLFDSLLNSYYTCQLLISKSTTWASSKPIVGSYLIFKNPSFNIAKEKINLAIDSIQDLLKKSSKISGLITSRADLNTGYRVGVPENAKQQFSTQVEVHAEVLGLPFVFTNTYSNQREPSNLNLKDLGVSLDVNKLLQQNAIKEKIEELKLRKIESLKSKTLGEIGNLDSSIYVLESLVQDPTLMDIENKKAIALAKLEALDSSKLTQEQTTQLQILRKSQLEKANQHKQIEELKNEKLKRLAELRSINLEEKKQELEKQAGFAKLNRLKSGIKFSPKLEALTLGKATPYFSELSLNSLTICGFSNKIRLNTLYLQSTAGVLTFSNFPTLNKNPYHLGIKAGFSQNQSDRYFLVSYINGNQPLSKNRFITTGFGGSEQVGKAVQLSYEIMYAESDSAQEIEKGIGSQSTLFSKFSSAKLAYNVGLGIQASSKINIQLTSHYYGLQFFNPGVYNIRTDLLRSSAKVNFDLSQLKTKLLCSIKLDRDNLTGLKKTNTSIKTYQVNPVIRLSKNWKLSYNFLYTRTNTYINGAELASPITYSALNHMLLLSHLKTNKKKTVTYSSQLLTTNFWYQMNENKSKVFTSCLTNSIRLTKQEVIVSNQLSYSNGNKDSSQYVQFLHGISKQVKALTLGYELQYITNRPTYSFKSFGLTFGYTKKFVSLNLKNELIYCEDRFKAEYPGNKPNYRAAAQLTIKF